MPNTSAIIDDLFDYLTHGAIDTATEPNTETAEITDDILRALRRKKGFGLFFVQCNPAQGSQVIKAIGKRFPEKRIEKVELSEQSETLYGELIERYESKAFDIACVTGVEQALYSYEDTKRLGGWSSEEVYSYSWKGVPPLLSHLNRQREAFEANLPIALIFFVPSFVIDYFVQRAPDFFDWRSGFFKLSESLEELKKASQELIDRDDDEYSSLTSDQRIEKILEIKDKVLQLQQSDYEQSSDLLREQGRLFQNGEEPMKALDCYNRAIALSPNNYKVLNSKGALLETLERYEDAISQYEAAIKIKPSYYQAWIRKSVILGETSRYEEALESYDRALEINPDYFPIWDLRGAILDKLERYEEALESYDRASEINPDYFYTWSLRGDVLDKLERYEEALESYDRALEINSDSDYVWKSHGLILDKLGRYEEALESYDRALEVNPEYSYVWGFRGHVFSKLERYEEALESYDHALEIEPNNVYAWSLRGNVLCNLKRHKEALASCDCALGVEPDCEYAWSIRGDALAKAERYEEALESYDHALEIEPNYDGSWRSRGDVLIKLERYEEALKSYDHALEIEPDHADTWVDKGIIFYRLSKFEESYNCFREAGRINPKDEVYWNNQGYLLLVQCAYGLKPVFEKPLLIRKPGYCEVANATLTTDFDKCRSSLVVFDKAVALNPKFVLAWANRSFPAYHLKDYQSALDSSNKALSIDPENEQEMNEVIYTNKGHIQLKMGNPLEALQSFSTALGIDSELSEAWIGKGTALCDLDRYSEAFDSFTQAHNLDHPLAQRSLELAQQHLSQSA